MDMWADNISSILEDNSILIYLLAKYVDNINIATSLIPEGTMWVKSGRKWTLKHSDEQKEVDREKAKSPQERTMERIPWVGNRLIPGIKLTKDLPE